MTSQALTQDCGAETWHGTVGGYTNHRCRGPRCSHAYREYMRAQKEKRRTQTPPERVHGTVGGYTNWDCRCEDCCRAMRAYRRGGRRDHARA